MKMLKFELVNGYGVLVEDKAEIKNKEYYIHYDRGFVYIKQFMSPNYNGLNFTKIIFAEPELQLEGVPVFNWRDFEIEKLAERAYGTNNVAKNCFVYGYKSNPAKYTEADMLIIRNKLVDFLPTGDVSSWDMIVAIKKYTEWLDEYLDSLKYPKYVVMESEIVSTLPTGNYVLEKSIVYKTFKERFKLFTNSEGKQEGTVKELIWD